MNYQQKMTAAIEAAERWQHQVVEREDEALLQARKAIRDKRPAKQRHLPVQMDTVLLAHIKKELENDVLYHRAVGNRNAQQTLAQMYGTAALVAAQYGDPAPPPQDLTEYINSYNTTGPGSRPLYCRDSNQPNHAGHDFALNKVHYWCPGTALPPVPATIVPCDDARTGQLHRPHGWADIDGSYYCPGA